MGEENYKQGSFYPRFVIFGADGRKSQECVREIKNGLRVYSFGGAEVATETLDPNGYVLRTTGKIPDGIVKEYHPNGHLKLELSFKNGKQEGKFKQYMSSGELMEEAVYKDGKLEGTRTIYSRTPMGVSTEYMDFVEDKPHGIHKVIFENGTVWLEEKYAEGFLDGIKKTYYKNGAVRSEENYRQGKLHGVKKIFHENGNLQTEELHKLGKLVEKRNFDMDGKLT